MSFKKFIVIGIVSVAIGVLIFANISKKENSTVKDDVKIEISKEEVEEVEGIKVNGVTVIDGNRDYNKSVLDGLNGDILYLKRDEDNVLKIYKSSANLENERLIYEHKSNINSNIMNLNYDKETEIITFIGYNDELNDWSVYEIHKDEKVVSTNKPTDFEEIENEDRVSVGDATVSNNEYRVYSEEGSMFLENLKTKEVETLREFDGEYNHEFLNGYKPVYLSSDNYLYYMVNEMNVPENLEELVYEYKMMVMNLETKEVSRYVDFSEILFIRNNSVARAISTIN